MSTRKQFALQDAISLIAAVEAFVRAARNPAVLDFGDKPMRLIEGQYALEVRSGRLSVEVWEEGRSLSRKILSVDRVRVGVLDCTVQRFGGATGTLAFLDLDRPQTAARAIRGSRQSFTEQFRRMLCRQFPGWQINSLSSALDLRRSFSATFPRAWLSRGHHHIAALACPSAELEPALLTSALLWYDHLASKLDSSGQLSLCLFMPEQSGNLTAHRLRWLTGRPLQPRMFRFNEHGMAGEIDPQDLGNLETRLAARYACSELTPELERIFAQLAGMEGVGCCPEIGGEISIRFRGLEFARFENGKFKLGIDSKEEVALSEVHKIESFARNLAGLGNSSPLGRSELPSFPERWFESSIRSNLEIVDPELIPDLVHGQVLTFAGGERELIDLLSITPSGRLAVLELKTSEDIGLPLQALDYWTRILWHAERDELNHLFPGVPVTRKAPKLLLVAPALSFHPSNEILLRYFSPEIEVERIGVNSDWESALQVAFRLRGADLPISHRGLDETRRIDQHKEGD